VVLLGEERFLKKPTGDSEESSDNTDTANDAVDPRKAA
ncbi:MAG: hypothetical protein ACI92S_004648, partial [Planctomycetaceae bacterium]